MKMTTVVVGNGEWNFACGYCRTQFLGFVSQKGAAEEGRRHARCTPGSCRGCGRSFRDATRPAPPHPFPGRASSCPGSGMDLEPTPQAR